MFNLLKVSTKTKKLSKNTKREAKRAFLSQDEEPRKGLGGLKQFTLQRVCMSLEKKRNTNRSSQYLVSRETCLGRALL